MNTHKIVVIFCLMNWGLYIFSQQILLDRPISAGELIVFPDITDANAYYYLSDKPKLATDENGTPQFSFIRYVKNVRSDEDVSREGEGGGIVHAVVVLDVTQEQIDEAKRELRRINPNGQIVGPVVYKSGRFSLVSSFKDEQGGLATRVIGLGNAPVLDGQKAAVSMQLTKQGATILWESFKTAAPDISFSFEMEIGGFRAPKKATIEANFDQIYNHKTFQAGLSTPYLAGEVKLAFDEMVKSGAIKVTQIGEDQALDALINSAYNKLAEMMFQPANGTGTPSISDLTQQVGGGQTSMLDRADALRTGRSAGGNQTHYPGAYGYPGAPHSGPPPQQQQQQQSAFAIAAAFQMRETKQRGIFKIDLNKYYTDQIVTRFDENIGNLSRLMNNPLHFRQFNLDDPLWRQREITAFVDGYNAADFGEYINFVTLRMQKKHESGEITDDEIRIDRKNFNQEGNNFKILYGWKGDNDRNKWMDYQYEVLWSFFGGHTVKEPMKVHSFAAINLRPPFQKRTVEIQADPDLLKEAEVRLISFKMYAPIGDTIQIKQATLNPAKNQLSQKLDFISAAVDYDYEYEITWRLTGNRVISSGRKKGGDAILFVDEIPK